MFLAVIFCHCRWVGRSSHHLSVTRSRNSLLPGIQHCECSDSSTSTQFSNTRSRRWKSRQAELGCLRGSLPAADTSASICNTYLSLECSELRSSSLQRPISPFAHSFAPRRCRPPPNSCPGACTLACCCSRSAESRLAMPFHSANTSSSGPGTFDGKPCCDTVL